MKQITLGGAGLALGPSLLSAQTDGPVGKTAGRIRSKGYAGRDARGDLSPWTFERRPVGDGDVLVDIKYSSICHSDIHTIRGHWGKQPYPLVPGHEITGIVAAVGKNVSRFKVGDKAGVGVIVGSCLQCDSCLSGEEQHCDAGMVGTYGAPEKSSPTGVTQGGYANNIVVAEHFVYRIPDGLDLQHAAPLLCAGITSYSPLIKHKVGPGTKVGVVGIGGLGHLAVKLAVSKGAEVYAFSTSPSKADDIRRFGAKEVIVVDGPAALKPWFGKMGIMISTVPYAYSISDYMSCVKPYGHFSQVGVPVNGELTINAFNMVHNRVNFSGSLVGGTVETQQLLNYCAKHKILPEIQMIKALEVNDAWSRIVNKQARYRYVIDAATI